MSLFQNIILTGFMGCGKTTVGRLLAEKLGRTFVDTDKRIEEEAQLSVAEIFAAKGENAFRAMERQMAVKLATQKNLVIATGGKMMLDPVNASMLGATGFVVCLTAAPEEILRRIKADKYSRPLIAGGDAEHNIKKLLKERRAGYALFPQVATDGQSPQSIASEIVALFNAL